MTKTVSHPLGRRIPRMVLVVAAFASDWIGVIFFQCGQNLLGGPMTVENFHQIDAHDETQDELENDHKPSWNIKLIGLTGGKMS